MAEAAAGRDLPLRAPDVERRGHQGHGDLLVTRNPPGDGPTKASRSPTVLVAAAYNALRARALSSSHSKSAPAVDPHEKHEQAMVGQLTFFQKHFAKPIDKDPEKQYAPSNRRFSLLSRGSIITMAALAVVLCAVVASAVAVTLDHKSNSDPLQYDDADSPVRLAILDNFPDPTLWKDGDTWYAFGTDSGAGVIDPPKNVSKIDNAPSNIQLAVSTDFIHWTQYNVSDEPLPNPGKWAVHGSGKFDLPSANVWAPSLIQTSQGDYLLYYTASINEPTMHSLSKTQPLPPQRTSKTGKLLPRRPPHCIGVAISESGNPAGPFSPVNDTLACRLDQGGAIDPAAIVDVDGTLWLTYKVNGNSLGHGGECNNMKAPIQPTPIMLQKMHPNGTAPDGDAIQILDRTLDDGPLVEAPDIVRTPEGKYFLFFSSGCTRDNDYDVKYAVADKITGPYTRAENKLLATGDWGLRAPGSVGIHEDDLGEWYMAFHARVMTDMGGVRAMFTTKLEFDGDIVRLVKS